MSLALTLTTALSKLARAFSMPTANLAAWYKAETGVTTATGAAVWTDQSGNGENLLTYSEQFDNAAWAKVGATITADAAVAPDGTTTADKMAEGFGTASCRVYQTGVLTATGTYVNSVHVSYGNSPFVNLHFGINSSNYAQASFSIGAGGVAFVQYNVLGSSFTSPSYTIDDLGGGHYRITFTITSIATNVYAGFGLLNAGTDAFFATYTGSGRFNYFWGAQVNYGSTATPYIATTATANTGRSLLQATAANQPVYLDYSGTKYGYHPGVAGNYFSTPDAAANQITGDIDLRWYGKLDTLSPVGNYASLVKKWAGGGYAYNFYLFSNKLVLYVGFGGTPTDVAYSSFLGAAGITINTLVWLRVTRDATTGAVNFYHSTDGVSWTAFTVSGVQTPGAMDASTVSVVIGGDFVQNLAGRTYRAQIWNGIEGSGGTLAVDFNPGDYTSGTTFPSSTTGETWTINSTGSLPTQIVDKASLLFNGTSHYLKTNAFTLNQPETIYLVAKQVSWTANDYLLDGNADNSGAILQHTSSPNIASYAGAYMASPDNPNLAVGNVGIIAVVFNGASSSIRINNTAAQTGNSGLNNMGGFTLGSSGNHTAAFANIQVYEAAIYSAAHDTATQNAIITGLAAKWGITL